MNSEFEELYKAQVEWAEIGFGPLSPDDTARIDNTWRCFEEEYKELQDAETTVDKLDAVCDLFVVNCQLCEFYSPTKEEIKKAELYATNSPIRNRMEYLQRCYKVLTDRKGYSALLLLMYWADFADALEICHFNIEEGIRRVTDSNYSKYPTIDSLRIISGDLPVEELLSSESSWIEENREGYSNIVGSVVTIEGNEYAVFRSDNGQGKIMKPSTYYEPFLEDLVPDGNSK